MSAKPLPNNLQAESDLIGNLVIDNKKIIDVISMLTPEDFYNGVNQIIYKAICDMYKNDTPIDITTLAAHLGEEGLRSIGGITKLSELVGSTLSGNVKTYAEIIKKLSIQREIIKSCSNAIEAAYSEQDPDEILSTLESKFVKTTVNKEKTYSIEEVLTDTVLSIENNYQNGGKIAGISTGYRKIDNAINGLVKGDLLIVAARPSMGKTAFILNIAKNVDRKNKVAIFEMEMSKEKIGARLLACKAGINATDLPRGKINANDFTKLVSVSNHYVAKDNIYINTDSSLSIYDIKTECKRLKLKYGLDIVIVDHLGYIKPTNPKMQRVQQVGEITKIAKAIAKELDVSVVLLSQLSRAVEQRQDKHPQLSDLRDSGNIEEDADTVLFLYRDDYYAEREKREKKAPDTIEVGIGKNRDGEVGWLTLKFLKEYQLITEEFYE